MEALLIGALMLKYDTIESTFWNLEPFLNIERNFGYFYYQIIIILKTVYVLYAMENAIPKFWILIFTACSKFGFIYLRPVLSISAYLTLSLHIFGVFFPQMALMGMLAISSKSYEFLLDIYVLLCTLYYATQTYKREIDKLVTIICFSLSLGSYINNIESAESFQSGVYYLLVLLCLATIFPLLPNRKQYGHRLVFFYMVLITWVIYKGDLHRINDGLSNSDICNITQHRYELQKCSLNETLESREKVILESLHLDNINYGSLNKLDSQAKNLTGVLNDDQMPDVNKKEATCEYNLIPDITCPMKVDSAEENSDTEMKEKTDGKTNAEIEHIETVEKNKVSLDEIYEKLILNSGDESNLLEEDYTNLRQEPFTEGIHNLEHNPLEDEIDSSEYYERSETGGYSDYGDESGREGFPVTETSVGDVDYKIEKRIGNTERIDNGIRHEVTYKAPVFAKVSDESEQQRSQSEEFAVMTQTSEACKSEETFKVLSYDLPNKGCRAEMTELQATGVGEGLENVPKGNEAGEVVDLSHVTDCIDNKSETRSNTTELQEAQTSEAKEIRPKPSEVREKDFTRIGSLKKNKYKSTEAVDLQVSDFDYKNSRNFIASVPKHTKDKKAKFFELQTTVSTDSKANEVSDINKVKAVYASENTVISPKRVDENQTAEYKATASPDTGIAAADKETDIKGTKLEVTETYVLSENEDPIPEAVPAKVLMAEVTEASVLETKMLELTKSRNSVASNFHSTQITENEENYLSSEKSDTIAVATANKNKVDSSKAEQASDFGSMEHQMTKSRETCTSQIQKPLRWEAKVITTEYTEPTVSTETKACEKDFALASYPRTSDYEICKTIDSTTNNHEISKASDSSESEHEPFKTSKSKTIQIQSPKDMDKTSGLNYEKENFDSKDRAVSSNDLHFDFPEKVGNDELGKYNVNAILDPETAGYQSTVFADSETATLQTTPHSQTSTTECKTAENCKTKRTEAGMFNVTETKETKAHESGLPKADMSKFTSASNPRRIELEPTKKDGAESSNTDTTKSHAYENSSKESNESKARTSETVLSKSQLAIHESEASGIRESKPRETEPLYTETTKSHAPKVYLSRTIESKSKQDGEDNHSRTKKLQTTETSYQNGREMDVIEITSPKESQLKSTKWRKTEDAFKEASELQDTKDNVLRTVESKQTQEQEVNDTIPNENQISYLRTKRLEATKASNSNTRETKTIGVAGPEKSQLNRTKYREIEDTFTKTTEPQATKNAPRTTDSKPTEERGVSDFTAGEHENDVSRHRTEKLEAAKASYPSARETKPIEVVGPEKRSPKFTEARQTDDAYKGETEIRAAKTGVSLEIERKPTQQGEVSESVESEPNKVSRRGTKELETTTVSYFDATEMKLIKVMGPEEGQLKTTKSGSIEIGNPKPTIGSENIQTN